MSDERARELERRWRESGQLDDRAAWLRERMRSGELPPEKLQLAAALGDAAACVVLGWPERPDPYRLALALEPLGQTGCARVAAAAAEAVLDRCPAMAASGPLPRRLLGLLPARLSTRDVAQELLARARGLGPADWQALVHAHRERCPGECGVLRALLAASGAGSSHLPTDHLGATGVHVYTSPALPTPAEARRRSAEAAVDAVRAALWVLRDERDAAATLIAVTLAQANPG